MENSRTEEIIRVVKHNWREEMVVARVYRNLAQREKKPRNRNMLSLMAVAEEEHAAMWSERLSKLGASVDPKEINELFIQQIKEIDARGVRATIRHIEKEERRHVGEYQAQIRALNDPESTLILEKVVPDEEHHSARLKEMIKEFSEEQGDRGGLFQLPPLVRAFFGISEAHYALVALIGLIGAWLASGPVATAFIAISLIAGGAPAFRDTLEKLKNRDLDIDLLMVMAALGAILIGSPSEGALLLFLFALSGALEEFALGRTKDAISKLAALRPSEARKVIPGKDAELLPVEDIEVGDLFIVYPGEAIPLDGVVTSGRASLDPSAITGESTPVSVAIGGKIAAGCLNLDGIITLKATSTSEDSTLSKIIELVKEAQDEKSLASAELFASKVGRYYTPIVLVGCAGFFIFKYFSGNTLDSSLYSAIALLIGASPCALVVSAPAAILSALAGAGRQGILVRSGSALEALSKIDTVTFDKTGTLTTGSLKVEKIICQGVTEDEALEFVASLEYPSPHPIARAIVKMAHDRNLSPEAAKDYLNVPGQGVEGSVNGVHGRAGKAEWLGKDFVQLSKPLKDSGLSIVCAEFGSAKVVFGLSDNVRVDAIETLKSLEHLGIRSIMLSGDHHYAAAHVASALGLKDYYGDLSPEIKVKKIKELSADGAKIAMIGDGVNDAPALAAASVGVALGGIGSDVALDNADVVIMEDKLSAVPAAVKLSRRALAVAKQNLIASVGSVVILVLAVLTTHVPLPLAVIGHEGTTVLVVLNGLRLIRSKI